MIDHEQLIAEIRSAGLNPEKSRLTIDDRGARFARGTAQDNAALASVVRLHVPKRVFYVQRATAPRPLRLSDELASLGMGGTVLTELGARDQDGKATYPSQIMITHGEVSPAVRAAAVAASAAHQGPTAQELADDAAAAKVSAVSQADLVAALKSLGVDLTA